MTLSSASRRKATVASALALVAALLTFGAPLSASADIVGDGPATVSGTVTLPDGTPVEGVFVNVSKSIGEGTTWSFSTTTDVNGAFEFAGVPFDNASVQVFASGFQATNSQTVELTESSPTASLSFVLVPFVEGIGSISGQVTADGVALPDVSVSISNLQTFQFLSTTTDENGGYQFSGLSNGPWQVNAFLPAYQFLPAQQVELSDAAPSASVDLAFVSWPVGTSAITGVVTDGATGLAVANVTVSLYGVDVAQQRSTTTDEAGAFTFDLLPAGSYALNFFAFGYLSANTEIAVAADEAIALTQALVPANATISGHIKAKDGSPIGGIYVGAHTSDGNFGGAMTDENGDYVITGLGAVQYDLVVGGVGTPYKQKTKTVTAAVDGSATANFTLKDRTTGALGGYIVSPTGEFYPAAVCVSLYSSKKNKAIDEVVTVGTDFGDGTYSFDDVKPGSYTLRFEDCDSNPVKAFDTAFFGGVAKYEDATFITIVAGQDAWENTFTAAPRVATSTISGHVEKSNGNPLAGLVVQATDGVASTVSAVTDANGNYTLTGLYADTYTVTVGGPPTAYKQKTKTVTTVANASVTADFKLSKN